MTRHLRSLLLTCLFVAGPASGQDKRPMTFMDVMNMRSASAGTISPDGRWFLYSLSTLEWEKGKRFTDVWLVNTERGPSSARRMTTTKDKNEEQPLWLSDSRRLLFLSDRESVEGKTASQLYMMPIDGGEARRVSDAKDGVTAVGTSRDGRWVGFLAGKDDERSLWLISTDSLEDGRPRQRVTRASGISWWAFSPDNRTIWFTSPDSTDAANKKRKEKKFDVRVRNEPSAPLHLWSCTLDTAAAVRRTSGDAYSVSAVTISDNGAWIGFRGTVNDRYTRTITESSNHGDLYLLETATGYIERLTNNAEANESPILFSPDNEQFAFSAPEDFVYFQDERIYLRKMSERGMTPRKIVAQRDMPMQADFWSDDGSTLYFTEGVRATSQLFAVTVRSGDVRQETNEFGSVSVRYDRWTRRIVITFSSPTEPTDHHTVDRFDRVGRRSAWKRLTDSNPQARDWQLGATDTVTWRSSDGEIVEGVLVLPVGYTKGTRVPLVVQIHGGPASAVTLSYNAGYGYYSHVFAAAGYAALLPNYRGSTNYGEKFRTAIVGDYFRQGYDDIMSGVDHLISAGVVDPERLAAMGWSAGGHWSNWILTHTDRFKAISSGAGTMNWISMYAQSDIQRGRQEYFGGKPYDNFDKLWDMSPLKYIKNAKTPTLIHVVDGDPRVPRPQSEELHMALRQLGVPTEFFVYPGSTHGITEPRNQLAKMVAEFRWIDRWTNGREQWLDWNELLRTLGPDSADPK